MKKKFMSICLCVCILCATCLPAMAKTELDLSYARGNSNFNIEVSSDGATAFISTNKTTSERSFAHELESDYYYSAMKANVLVGNYYSASPNAILLIDIDYCADEYLNATSVTFTIEDKNYTFFGIGDASRRSTLDHGISERLYIILGSDSKYIDFVSGILSQGIEYHPWELKRIW